MTAPISLARLSDIQALEQQQPLAQRNLPASTYELLQRSASRFGERTALTFLPQGSIQDQPWNISYAELFAQVTRTANALHRLGIRPGKAVSFLLPNLPQTHYVIWGGEAAGIVNAINPLLEPAHIAELVRASRTTVLVTLAPFPGTDLWQKVANLRERLPELEAIVTIDLANLLPEPQRSAIQSQRPAMPEDVLDFDSLLAACPADHLESGRAIQPDDIASYFHTGGTTGTPKLAPHSHLNEVAMAEIISLHGDYDSSDVLLCGLPLFHVNGVMVTGLSAFHRGARVLLAGPQGYRNPTLIKDFWQLVERYRVSCFSGVPTIYAALLQVPNDGIDVSSLRFAVCGAAPMPVELIRQFEARSGLKIIEGYGLTEGTCATSCNPQDGERRPGSIGLRLPYCEVKIAVLDNDGHYLRDAATDEPGNVCLRGPTVFKGYLQADKNQGLWLDGGWFNTGDLGRIDRDGYIWLTGRSKDLIIRGGHNIDPQMIEEALHRHPAVAMAAAVGKPDIKAGELPVVYVQLKAGASAAPAELLEHAARHIHERAALPKDVWLLEQIPLTAVGKTFKPALRLDAIRRVFEDEVRQVAEGIRVEAVSDDRHGQRVDIHVPGLDATRRAALEQRLSSYAVRYQLHSA
ncbi:MULTISPECIES: acyl-CoA synthetase [Pseudomonas]|uniref:acyl-CoA synthetase n=1 Tax=Pseudomonas TaxID=286 RepID=UPI000B350AB6|nr:MULTISPECIES: acyl-CoA synthetase [Pseudomonas]PMY68868.1 cyclohexanecarboxylate-CoA ligase [Pseudomonas sp. FW305-25]PMY72934.1 cyclohexanecarboxylate-CoA ligase [Pseudomonas sp. FW126-L8]PNA82828.1 cyclohexanecarboxylate-CoA ligase [Pseudomonas sp. FW305-76]